MKHDLIRDRGLDEEDMLKDDFQDIDIPDSGHFVSQEMLSRLSDGSHKVCSSKNLRNLVAYLCEECHKMSYRRLDDENDEWVCPYCGYRHNMSDLEEIHVTQHSYLSPTLLERMHMLSEHRKSALSEIHVAADDGNTTKEQISLEMGSEEYQEYLDDKRENSAQKPDDIMHEELEIHNENLTTSEMDAEGSTPEAKIKESVQKSYIKANQAADAQKRDIHAQVIARLKEKAMYTSTIADDAVARSIGEDNPIMSDDNVDADEYESALEEYVMDSID